MNGTLDKTLEEIEGQDWGEPEYFSHLVVSSHRLRRVPLRDFTVEDLRLMLGQKFSLEHLVPLALEHLEDNPVVSGDFYEGDLLEAVQKLPQIFWEQHADLQSRWHKVQERLQHNDTYLKPDP